LFAALINLVRLTSGCSLRLLLLGAAPGGRRFGAKINCTFVCIHLNAAASFGYTCLYDQLREPSRPGRPAGGAIVEDAMPTENVGMRKHQEGVVMTDPIRLHSIRTRALVGAIVAAGLATAAVANVWAARPDEAVSAANDAGETVVPAARLERGGSLAVYPPVY
jgi:hypothetical protein